MITKYDITRLKSLDVERVAEALGITVRCHKAICPFHDDTRPSLTFNLRHNQYRCFVCEAWGDCIQLVMNSQEWSFYESCLWLARQLGIMLEEESNYMDIRKLRQQVRKVKPEPEPPPIDVYHLENLLSEPHFCDEACRFLYEERKISPEVVQQAGLSSISRPVPMSGNPNGPWFNAPSLLIPYRDIDGNLLSVQARYLGEKRPVGELVEPPRFQFPKGSRCTIFNLELLKHLEPVEPLWITEGVSDCLAMMSSGRMAIAIPSATLLRPEDLKPLGTLNLELGTTFHMAPDNDIPGARLFQELQKMIPDLHHHLLPAKYKDFGQYWMEQAPALGQLAPSKAGAKC